MGDTMLFGFEEMDCSDPKVATKPSRILLLSVKFRRNTFLIVITGAGWLNTMKSIS